MPLRLLAVHAHPDDESSKGAATYAHYRKAGVEVLVVSCTGGERASILNEHLEARAHAERDIAGLRSLEMARAQEAMGVDHRLARVQRLRVARGGRERRGQLVRDDSRSRSRPSRSCASCVGSSPHVLLTYDENGGYPHPDHIRTHEVSVAAYEAAADPARYPDAGPAWQVSKLYYDRIMNTTRMRAIYEAIKVETPDSPVLTQMDEMFERWGERARPRRQHR